MNISASIVYVIIGVLWKKFASGQRTAGYEQL